MSTNMHFPNQGYERPSCPNCSRVMMLSRLDRENSDKDKRTFECVACNRYESIIVQYR
jgi:hypothetical protein